MTLASMSADVVIVGGGIIGLSTAERLTAQGRSVILVDQEGAAGGATRASGGLVRAFEPSGHHPAWAAEGCALYRRRGWHGTWPPMHEDGSLTLIDRHDAAAATITLEAVREAGHDVEILSRDEMARRFPGLDVPGHLLGVFEPCAGWLPAAEVATALRRDAGSGLRLCLARATGLRQARSGIQGVETTVGLMRAPAVLLAAGVGSAALASSVGVRLALRTRSVSYCLFRPENQVRTTDLPTVVDHTTGAWLRRWGTDRSVLAGVRSSRMDVQPRVTVGVPAAEEERIRAVVRHRWPHIAEARPVGGITAYDATLVDGSGAVTAWPRPRGLVTAVGWNGGGFKLAPAIGRRAAAELLGVLADE